MKAAILEIALFQTKKGRNEITQNLRLPALNLIDLCLLVPKPALVARPRT
jgi:hypothetical protein